MDALLSFEPRLGSGLPHDPMNAIVGPRPIGWISTVSADGVPNLAPYSFFNLFNYRPPIVAWSSIGFKDSVRNAQATGGFVCNLVTTELATAMNASSAMVAPQVNEFELAGLTPRASTLVAAPAVAESPVQLECRVLEVKRLHNLQGEALDTWMVLGEVVMVHIERRLIGPDGVYDTAAAQPILRGGGPADYFQVSDSARFRMTRPG